MKVQRKIEVGQVWQDRDKRMDNRRMRVVDADDRGKVRLEEVYGSFTLTTRVCADGLRKRWRLVYNPPAASSGERE